MRILITSGLGAKDVGGHSQYAVNLSREFKQQGHMVYSEAYGNIEKKLPMGIRHLYFFTKIFWKIIKAESVLTLDSFSVGIPSLLGAKILNKKIVARIGGDFLWESYVNETENKLTITEFYKNRPELSLKHKIIYQSTKFFTKHIDHIVFNSIFQKEIWENEYNLSHHKTSVIYNFVPPKIITNFVRNKTFLWAGRDIPLKNVSVLIEAVTEVQKIYPDVQLEIITNQPRHEVLEKIKNCRASILPSLSEMSPNFMIEAITLGKPFICTKESGLAELYSGGGIYINPHDKQQLIEAVIEMVDDDKYKEFVRIINTADKTHTWDTIAKEYLNILCR